MNAPSRTLRFRPRSSAAALAAAYLLFRLAPSALSVARTVRQALSLADDATAVAARAAAETRAYLDEPTATAPPPRALRRVLRALAAPDALRVLRHLASAAASGAVRAATATSADVGRGGNDPIDVVLRALASPSGERVARNVISAAVREAVLTGSEIARHDAEKMAAKGAKNTAVPKAFAEQLIDAALSEQGRRFLLDAVAVITRAAVPAFIAAKQAQTEGPTVNCTSPVRRRLDLTNSPRAPPGTTRSVTSSATQSPAGSGVLERVAARALRDRSLVRDVVRTGAAEAIRAYLTTQARLRLAVNGAAASAPESEIASPLASPRRCGSISAMNGGAGAIGGSGRMTSANERTRGNSEKERQARALEQLAGAPAGDVPSGLWRMLVRSVVSDVRRAVLRFGATREQPGWIVF